MASVAVHLQHALDAGEVRGGALGLAVGRRDADDPRRIGTAPGPIVANVGPQLPGLGPAAPRIQHRGGRLVGEELTVGLHALQWPVCSGLSSRPPGPARSAKVKRSRSIARRA
jgi:hypothetical protein